MSVNLRQRTALVVCLLLAFIIQTTVAPKIRLLGVQPDVVLILTVTIALMRGPLSGSMTGFAGGMLRDFQSQGMLGIDALIKSVLGFVAGRAAEEFGFSVMLGLISVFVGSMVSEFARLLIGFIIGISRYDIIRELFFTALPFAIYNTLLFPLVFLAIEKLVGWPDEQGAGMIQAGRPL